MDPQTDQNPQQQLVERLRHATNILVTVSANPSVDQLAACIGLTLWLNKLGKHATAVFSGEVPSTLEFLKPEETLEKDTNSLRDFIIALDKSKADKLRYKVEDRVVKIFITPYRTSLSADDLEFSQGDFNVDAVVALGVAEQQDLDNAIQAHGRILHDATVMSINTAADGGLGSINWHEPQASSLSELVMDVGKELGHDQLDEQIATALLTGIVAETDRFSNNKTFPQTMSIAADLMAAGANQQLVASQLEGTADDGAEPLPDEPQDKNGTLEIQHRAGKKAATDEPGEDEKPDKADEPRDDSEDTPDEAPAAPSPDEPADDGAADESPTELAALPVEEDTAPESEETVGEGESHIANAKKAPKLVTTPPTLGGTLTANSQPERTEHEPVTDPLSLPEHEDSTLLTHEPELKIDEPAAENTVPEVTENAAEPAAATDPTLGPPPPHWEPPDFLKTAPPPSETDLAATQPDAEAVTPPPLPPPPVLPDEPAAAAPASDEKPLTGTETLSEIEQSVSAPPQPEPPAGPGAAAEAQEELAEDAREDLDDVYKTNPPAAPPDFQAALNAPSSEANTPVTASTDASAAPQPVEMPDNPSLPPPLPPPSTAFLNSPAVPEPTETENKEAA